MFDPRILESVSLCFLKFQNIKFVHLINQIFARKLRPFAVVGALRLILKLELVVEFQ